MPRRAETPSPTVSRPCRSRALRTSDWTRAGGHEGRRIDIHHPDDLALFISDHHARDAPGEARDGSVDASVEGGGVTVTPRVSLEGAVAQFTIKVEAGHRNRAPVLSSRRTRP